MAKRKPLVLVSGAIQQLQAGDYLGDEQYISLINGEAGAAVICMPVYISAADTAKKARANAGATVPAMGFIVDTSVAAGASANVQTQGVLTATTAQWDAVAGTTGGLTAGQSYFLSDTTAGQLISTQAASGYCQELGIALSATELLIKMKGAIQL